MRGPAFFAYADNYLIDVKFGITAEVGLSPLIVIARANLRGALRRGGIKPWQIFRTSPTLCANVDDVKASIAPTTWRASSGSLPASNCCNRSKCSAAPAQPARDFVHQVIHR